MRSPRCSTTNVATSAGVAGILASSIAASIASRISAAVAKRFSAGVVSAFRDDGGDRGVDGRRQWQRRTTRREQVQRPERVVRVVRGLAREEVVEGRAERPEVRAPIDLAAERLLGGHVLDLALEDAGVRLPGQPVARLGDPEVDDLGHALHADEDVVRADVAVDDLQRLAVVAAQLVRLVQPRAGVGEDPQHDPVGTGASSSCHARRSFESESPSTYSIAR